MVDGLLVSLASSSLRNVQILVHAPSPQLGEHLERLASVSSTLDDLTVYVMHADPQPFASQCLLPHTQLRRLVLGKPQAIPVTPQGLDEILSHLSLESLSIGLSGFQRSMAIWNHEHLLSLECDGSPSDFAVLLSFSNFPSLQTLTLRTTTSSPYDPDTHHAVALSLANNSMALTLRSLTWSYANSAIFQSWDTPVAVYGNMLEPLCGRLPNLEVLSIQVQHPVMLHEDELYQFAPHWPKLKKLELPLRHYLMPDAEAIRSRSKLPSAIGLAAIAGHCTALEYLALELSDDWTISRLFPHVATSTDAVAAKNSSQEPSSSTSADEDQSPPRQKSTLQRLYLTLNEPIADQYAFAQFIDQLFPELDIERCDARVLSEDHDGYKPVRGMWESVDRLQRRRDGEITESGCVESVFGA